MCTYYLDIGYCIVLFKYFFADYFNWMVSTHAWSDSLFIQHLQGLKSPFKFIGFDDGTSHVEARYPAILFKQQLTACVEKIFGLIRDNLKKELSPLLGLCIHVSFY